MATTGILLRGDTFANIYADPPIVREATTAGEHVGYCTITGSVYWLNIAMLSKIGAITDSSGNTQAGVKTSDMPIDYDSGYIAEEATYMSINGTYSWNHAALGAITVLDDLNFTFATQDIDVANWDFITTFVPSITNITSTSITVDFAKGSFVEVYNEATGNKLGTVDTTGGTLSFSAQTSGNSISVRAVDTHYNRSATAVNTIP